MEKITQTRKTITPNESQLKRVTSSEERIKIPLLEVEMEKQNQTELGEKKKHRENSFSAPRHFIAFARENAIRTVKFDLVFMLGVEGAKIIIIKRECNKYYNKSQRKKKVFPRLSRSGYLTREWLSIVES